MDKEVTPLKAENGDVKIEDGKRKSSFIRSRKMLYLVIGILAIFVVIFFILLLVLSSRTKKVEKVVATCETESCVFAASGKTLLTLQHVYFRYFCYKFTLLYILLSNIFP